MATCYVCGRKLRQDARNTRKKVKTGERLKGRRGSRGFSVTTSFGMRTLCEWCGRKADSDRRKEELIQHVELGIALAFVAIALLAKLLN